MGRYTGYGIVTSFYISRESLDESIRRKMYNKKLSDYEADLPELLKKQMPEIYDLTIDDNWYEFRLKDYITMKDIVGIASEFFKIFPREISGETPEILESFKEMSVEKAMEEVKDGAGGFNFHYFCLPYYLYAMPVTIEGKELYPDTNVSGFELYTSDFNTSTENDLEPYDFLTQLIRYRLKEHPLADSLLAYLTP